LFLFEINNKRAQKTFKLRTKKLKIGESITVLKEHSFKPISTRKLYIGKHKIALFVNGKIIAEKSFELIG